MSLSGARRCQVPLTFWDTNSSMRFWWNLEKSRTSNLPALLLRTSLILKKSLGGVPLKNKCVNTTGSSHQHRTTLTQAHQSRHPIDAAPKERLSSGIKWMPSDTVFACMMCTAGSNGRLNTSTSFDTTVRAVFGYPFHVTCAARNSSNTGSK